VTSHEHHTHRILTELEAGNGVSQRSLSRDLGIALGLTNLLIRRLARKGWIRVVHLKPNRVSYLLTPAGIAEKARMTRAYFHNSVRFYAEARDRIRQQFSNLSNGWAFDGESSSREKRVVFFGGGEVAEIAYICLQDTDLRLVGVVDNTCKRFFDVPVYTRRQLRPDTVGGAAYDCVVVMSFADDAKIRRRLEKCGLPPERVIWI
jgi:DNA-binding MarR family transcriptional regulator